MVNGKNSNITWSAKNTAKLVLIYLKPIEKESNLIVRYWNSSSNEEITHSQVVMTYNQGDQEPSFTSALKNARWNCHRRNYEVAWQNFGRVRLPAGWSLCYELQWR